MILLPFGCYCSPLKVHPKNWQTSSAPIKKDWYIFYRFYDPVFRDSPKLKKGKLVIIKGVNHFKTRTERQIADETSIKEYELEYCTDGISYSSILTTETPQGEATNNYSYLHTAPAVGNNYYRIKIVNDDGSFSYSNIVPIDIQNDITATIYPNPATDNIVITLPNANKSLVNIYNSTGSLVKTTTVYSITSTMDIHNLLSGTYFINVIENDTLVINQAFIKE